MGGCAVVQTANEHMGEGAVSDEGMVCDLFMVYGRVYGLLTLGHVGFRVAEWVFLSDGNGRDMKEMLQMVKLAAARLAFHTYDDVVVLSYSRRHKCT